jgi:uncharacterized protein HemX
MDNMNQTPSQVNAGASQNTTPVVPQTPPVMSMNAPQQKKSGVGSIIATIIIIAIIILGGLYFWGKRIETQNEQQAMIQDNSASSSETAAVLEATKIETVSQDDSLNAIDSETKTTNTTNLSPELQ